MATLLDLKHVCRWSHALISIGNDFCHTEVWNHLDILCKCSTLLNAYCRAVFYLWYSVELIYIPSNVGEFHFFPFLDNTWTLMAWHYRCLHSLPILPFLASSNLVFTKESDLLKNTNQIIITPCFKYYPLPTVFSMQFTWHQSPSSTLSFNITSSLMPPWLSIQGLPFHILTAHLVCLFLSQLLSLLIIIHLAICLLVLPVSPPHPHWTINSVMVRTCHFQSWL